MLKLLVVRIRSLHVPVLEGLLHGIAGNSLCPDPTVLYQFQLFWGVGGYFLVFDFCCVVYC